ncbi:hypothetical protein EJ02DRAFT_96516 [Clathrospora elynae]|uniref:Uncharacterized protein n=1 Tax=Clathrospora elynae TaxID=706981 RepID=A0A6A5SA19_9PLEO|nr:hypothetical protein EJ02DRAFT_96516 [Clathrospora elynae]
MATFAARLCTSADSGVSHAFMHRLGLEVCILCQETVWYQGTLHDQSICTIGLVGGIVYGGRNDHGHSPTLPHCFCYYLSRVETHHSHPAFATPSAFCELPIPDACSFQNIYFFDGSLLGGARGSSDGGTSCAKPWGGSGGYAQFCCAYFSDPGATYP